MPLEQTNGWLRADSAVTALDVKIALRELNPVSLEKQQASVPEGVGLL